MRTLRATTMALIALLFTIISNASEESQLSEARKVATSLPPKLMATLQAEISKSGPEGAIHICKDIAPKMAIEIAQQTGWKIKRVSLKARNDARAIPDAWEKAALEDFDRRAAAGEPPAQLEKGEMINNEYRYVKALPVKPICLSCHGSGDQISSAVKAELEKNYIDDRATGYTLGQIRGAISVRK